MPLFFISKFCFGPTPKTNRKSPPPPLGVTFLNNSIFSDTSYIDFLLNVEELGISHCNDFWGKYADNVSSFEKLKIFSVVGGEPKYLEEINPAESAESNIKRV